jgi:hypothetical protein
LLILSLCGSRCTHCNQSDTNYGKFFEQQDHPRLIDVSFCP